MSEYEKCKCAKHPAIHPDDFDMLFFEYGMFTKEEIEKMFLEVFGHHLNENLDIGQNIQM